MSATRSTDATILVVDDEEDTAMLLRDVLRKRGYTVDAVCSAAQCLDYLRDGPVDVVLTDVEMPGMSGIELCAQLAVRYPDTAPIVLTGFGKLDTAIAAIRAGAYDFLIKPVSGDALAVALDRALDHFTLQREVKRLNIERPPVTVEGIEGDSPAIRQMIRLIRRVASTDAPVLITGESGTGKERVARALHRSCTARRDHPFVAVNCGAMPAPLLESELFGHVRGAFTDAHSSRQGLFVQAGLGTILLDEIGELPLEMQAKLLRVLQARRVRPVGADEEVAFNARVIVATNRDLATEVDEGRFREDLFHRINVVAIDVPPLRARAGDILTLANAFAVAAAARKGKRPVDIGRKASQLLIDYHWPGNVRELENCIERAVTLCHGAEIDPRDLPAKIVDYKSTRIELATDSPQQLLPLAEMEQRYVRQVLAAVAGNKTHAARILGIDRRSIYRRLEEAKAAPDEARGRVEDRG